MSQNRNLLIAAVAMTSIVGCGGDNSGTPQYTHAYEIGVTVTGVDGTGLTLELNGSERLPIPRDGRYLFATPVASGATYAVAIRSQPTPQPGSLHRTCVVHAGIGTIGGADVDIAVTCSGVPRFVYVVNHGSDNISGFSIDSITGALTVLNGSPFATEAAPTSLTVHPSGNFAYVPAAGTSSISEYAIDATSGSLTPLHGSPVVMPVPEPGYPLAQIEIDASGKLAIVGNPNAAVMGDTQTGNLAVWRIANDGELTAVPGSPFTTHGLFPDFVELDPANRFVYVQNSNRVGGSDGPSIDVFALDSGAGTLTTVGGSPFGHFPQFSAFQLAPSGKYGYIVPSPLPPIGAVQLLVLNGMTGAVTPGSKAPFAGKNLAVHPDGRFMYVTNGGVLAAFSVDSTRGTFTAVGGTPVTVSNSAALGMMTVDPTGRFLYMTAADAIYGYSIDSSTGTVSVIPGAPFTLVDSPQALLVATLSIDPTGTFVYALGALNSFANTSLYAFGIDPVTGGLTRVAGSPFATGSASEAIAFRQ